MQSDPYEVRKTHVLFLKPSLKPGQPQEKLAKPELELAQPRRNRAGRAVAHARAVELDHRHHEGRGRGDGIQEVQNSSNQLDTTIASPKRKQTQRQ